MADPSGGPDGAERALDALFAQLSEVARPAGSSAEAAARGVCVEWLTQRGYHCVERPFMYSAWPGRFGVAAVGIVLAVAAAIVAGGSAMGAVHASLAVGVALTVGSVGAGLFLTRYGTTTLPWDRRHGTNLEARQMRHGAGVTGDLGEPDVWLIAHLDSKSQSISMRVRVTAVITCAVAWVVLTMLWAMRAAVPVGPLVYAAVAAVATIAACPLATCRTGSEGTGAFDNASGVTSVLGALDFIDPSCAVGVLVTSAEELGLAGARAWLADRRGTEGPSLAINCDGVDDEGDTVCMLSGATEYQFRDAFHRAGVMAGEDVIVRPLIPGVLVDAVAFKDAGWRAVTVSRGTWRSLARVHTRADVPARMTGRGIGRTARFIGRLAGAMVAEGRASGRDGQRLVVR